MTMPEKKPIQYFHAINNGKEARLPTKRDGDAGYDLYAQDDYVLDQVVTKIPLGIGFANSLCSGGYYAQILGRSGIALAGLFPIGGVIDASYRGEIAVTLAKLTPGPYRIQKGDRIAQLVFIKIIDDVEMEFSKDISATERGAGGFGSSGK
jgi:dUTP pyrophosphatase